MFTSIVCAWRTRQILSTIGRFRIQARNLFVLRRRRTRFLGYRDGSVELSTSRPVQSKRHVLPWTRTIFCLSIHPISICGCEDGDTHLLEREDIYEIRVGRNFRENFKWEIINTAGFIPRCDTWRLDLISLSKLISSSIFLERHAVDAPPSRIAIPIKWLITCSLGDETVMIKTLDMVGHRSNSHVLKLSSRLPPILIQVRSH